jgi:hypothetical protein
MLSFLSKPKMPGTDPSLEGARDNEGTVPGLVAEVVFAALPLLLIVMIYSNTGKSAEIFASPEWSFGSAVLFGQTLARFVRCLAQGGGHARPGAAALITALLLVFGLAPALIINAITLTQHAGEPNRLIAAFQVVDFAVAAFVYVVIGDVAERR